MKRGIDIIRALYPQPTELDRMLALDELAGTWRDWMLDHRAEPPLWLIQPLSILPRVHQPFYDTLIRTSGYTEAALAKLDKPLFDPGQKP